MRELPRTALVVDIQTGYPMPVEAPPCDHCLDLFGDNAVHLRCDKQKGHAGRLHRQFLTADSDHAGVWCEDNCAEPCDPTFPGLIEQLRAQGIQVRTGWRDVQ